MGCAIAAVGFGVWASKVTHLDFLESGHLDHRGRCRHGHDAGPGQHGRDQPGLESLLRGGDRHHPDDPELRGQSRPGGAGHHLADGATLQADGVAHGARHVPHAAQVAATDLAVPGWAFGELHSPLRTRWTLPTRPNRSSTSCAGSWASPAWWPFVGPAAGAARDRPDVDAAEVSRRPSEPPVTHSSPDVRETLLPPPGWPSRSAAAVAGRPDGGHRPGRCLQLSGARARVRGQHDRATWSSWALPWSARPASPSPPPSSPWCRSGCGALVGGRIGARLGQHRGRLLATAASHPGGLRGRRRGAGRGEREPGRRPGFAIR